MATSGSFDSITITAGSGDAYKSRYLTFSWAVKSTTTGKTTISWEIYGRGGNTTYSTFSVSLNGKIIASANDEVISYKSSTPLWSGEETYTHNTSGDATVSISISVSKIWNTISTDTRSKDWALDKNYPYTDCTAPTAASITLSPAIQKPGGDITISWNAGVAGTGMSISKYQVQYKIGSGSWVDGGYSTTTSKKITLPSTASRGETISAQVKTIGSVSGYDSGYRTGSGTSKVNRLPGAPTVTVNKDLVSSSGEAVTFTLSAGSVGTNESQTPSIYYATSTSGAKAVCSNGFKPTVASTTTYYFWTYDGLEYSSSYVSKTITVNSKPTLDFSISGSSTSSSQTVTFSKGSNGQSSGNKYTFGFTCNNTSYTLVSAQTSTTYTIGDMRKQLSDKLGYLNDNTTYSYSFWAYRSDGIETSDTVTKSAVSISIPKFTLVNDKKEAAPFSRRVTVATSGTATGSYTSVGFSGATTSGLVLTTTNLAYGTTLDKLLVNNSFYVKPATTLHKVFEIDITPSSGRSSPYDPTTFNSYTTNYLNISLLGRTDAKYGLTSAPQLKLKNENELTTIGTYSNKSGNNTTYLYEIPGSTIYSNINTGNNSAIFTLSIENKFGDVFSKQFTLSLDNTMPAIPYTSTSRSIDLYPGKVNSSTKYPGLNSWKYLKEGMPIHCDFSVLAFNTPTFNLEVYNLNGSQIWESLKSNFSINSEDSGLTSYGDYKFNTSPKIYYVSSVVIKGKIDEVLSNHEIQFRMTISTPSHAIVYSFFNGEKLPVKAHYGAKAYFTETSYSGENLYAKWSMEDEGFDSEEGSINSIAVQVKERNTYFGFINYPSTPQYTWVNFGGFEDGSGKKYESLHIAPRIVTTLTTSTKTNSSATYSGKFSTTKTTSSFLYAVVYNVAPTVSYRKNFLGINTNDFSKFQENLPVGQENSSGYIFANDVALAIGAHNKNRCVYFYGSENTSKINAEDGTLHNFIIMGGSWDGTDNYIDEQIEYRNAESVSF